MAEQRPFIKPDPEEENVWRIVLPITPQSLDAHRICVWPPNDEAEAEIQRRLAEGEEMEDILGSPETFSF